MSYRLKCRNPKCGAEFLRHYPKMEFENLQYGGGGSGIGCFQCGFPKMFVLKSGRVADDGFKPGFQRNIRKYCQTYEEYKAHLKAMGLVEIGYEELPKAKEYRTNYWTDDILKKLYDMSPKEDKLSDREAEHMKEYHKLSQMDQ